MTPSGRLLIVSYHFPPADTVGARRPGALARFAAAEGWDVRVLAGAAPDVAGACPAPDVAGTGPTPEAGTGLGPVTRCAAWFPERAAPPVRAAATRTGGRPLAAARDGLIHRARRVAREVLLLPDRHAGWILPAVRGFLRGRGGWRPDVIVASGPPFSAFIVARILGGRLAVPWVADYRDLWTVGTEYWPYGRSRPRRRIDHLIERRLAGSARSCVTVSEPLAAELRRTFHTPVRVIMNGIDRRPPPAVRAVAEPGGPGGTQSPPPAMLTLAHTGISIAGKRDPTPLLQAMALLGPQRDRVRLLLAGVGSSDLRPAARATGTADQVRILGPVSPAESWRIQAEADVLVLLMWNDPRDVGTVTGKIFDYLQARRPILVLGYPGGAAADLVESRGAGVVCNDPRKIADQLRAWLSIKDRAGGLPPLPAAALDGLYREDQLRHFLDVLG